MEEQNKDFSKNPQSESGTPGENNSAPHTTESNEIVPSQTLPHGGNEGPLNFQSRIDLRELQENMYKIKQELQKVIVGQREMVDLLLVSILANGHALIEGVPGVAKTITAKLLSRTLQVGFSRIQFTPDLMPSDILGTSVFNAKTSDFEFKKGPIFSNMILIEMRSTELRQKRKQPCLK